MTLEDVVALELSLLDPQVRRSPERVQRLLHPDFREFGVSGAWERDGIVAALAADPGPGWEATEVEAREVASGVVLVLPRGRLAAQLALGRGAGGLADPVPPRDARRVTARL